MEIITEPINVPENVNIIFGMSHFIKTVEDIYEAIVNTNNQIKFGIAFNEASGQRLVRYDGNEDRLIELAQENQLRIGAGHTFLITIKNGFPINILPAIKNCREVVTIFCATANKVEVILAKTKSGRGVLGVVDGETPKGIEFSNEINQRKKLLRDIGYKR